MKPILALNAFDMRTAAGLGGELAAQLRQRAALFGAASVLFYDRPLQFVRGLGCRLFDRDGVSYLDAYNNVPSVGHGHPRVVAATCRQLAELNIHNRYLHPGVMDYAARLTATLPAALSNIAFTCTGSESNDLALRLAANFSGARGVIVTAAAYHGNTSLVTEVSPSSYKQGAPPPHVRVIPAPADAGVDLGVGVGGEFARQVGGAISDLRASGCGFSALIIDSIFSSDGVYADPPGFLRAAVDVVHAAGGLVIADEVQSGFGRTGAALWGFARHGIEPDVVTLGKPMGNGYPMGAVMTRPEILSAFCAKVGYFNTFGGSPVSAAVGRAVLDVIEQDGLMENARLVGGYLKSALSELAGRHAVIGAVRGAGLYIGVELVRPQTQGDPGGAGAAAPVPALATAVINALRERRILIGAAGLHGNVLKIRPPLCFATADADELVAGLDAVLSVR